MAGALDGRRTIMSAFLLLTKQSIALVVNLRKHIVVSGAFGFGAGSGYGPLLVEGACHSRRP